MEIVNRLPVYFPMGEQAIVAQFEKIISIQESRKVQSFMHVIGKKQIPGVTDLLPAFNNLTICYDPIVIRYDELLDELKRLENEITEEERDESKTIHIPVTYDQKYGIDLDEIARKADLTTDEVVKEIHTKEYFVYMIGFIAGYPYCGNIDERLRFKRRDNPRVKCKKGTIQIVDKQIGIITMEAPSGWHLIGWTPMEIFNPNHLPPGLLGAGNYVKYVPISLQEAEAWSEGHQKEWDREWNM